MSNVIGNYKEFVIIERESLNLLEQTVSKSLEEAQNDHNVEDIRKAKVWIEAIEWIKKNNIYTQDFQIKQ